MRKTGVSHPAHYVLQLHTLSERRADKGCSGGRTDNKAVTALPSHRTLVWVWASLRQAAGSWWGRRA